MSNLVIEHTAEESLCGNPVASLQTMLRQLGVHYPFLPIIAIDGIFGEETLEAVMLFQRELFPPVTGVVDLEVWSAIREEYTSKTPLYTTPKPLRTYPEGGVLLAPGEQNHTIVMVQTMMALLSNQIRDLTPEPTTGKFTQTLEENVKWLQKVSLLPQTGVVDQVTWERLARLYEIVLTAR